jgi:hypothetical protein
MLLFTDLHCREDSASVVIDEVLPGLLQACLQHGEREIACLGDFYHFRYRIDVRLQNAVRAWLLDLVRNGILVHMLPGNHDQVDIAGRNALEVFDGINGVRVYTEPTWTEHGLWVPYRKNPDDIARALQMPYQGKGATPKILFMHHGVRGAMMNNTMADTEGLDPAMFEPWRKVLCGHYHKRQTVGRVTYLGSPWQTRSDEAGQPKGYARWDHRELTFYDTAWGPRYHQFVLEPGQALDLSQVGPRDDVRVRTASGVDPEKVGQQLAQAGLRHTVTPEVKVAEARLAVPDGADLRTYAYEFLKQAETPLDKKQLLDVLMGVIS